MARNKLMLVGLLVGVAMLTIAAVRFNDAEGKGLQWGPRRLEGAWYGGAGGAKVMMTAIPQDPLAYRVTLTLHNLNGDPNLGGAVEQILGIPATAKSDWTGEAVRTGPNTYEYSLVEVAINDDPANVDPDTVTFPTMYTAVSSGVMTLTDSDNIERTLNVAYYLASQDPFSGETPLACDSYTSTLTRIHPMPPCEDQILPE